MTENEKKLNEVVHSADQERAKCEEMVAKSSPEELAEISLAIKSMMTSEKPIIRKIAALAHAQCAKIVEVTLRNAIAEEGK